jgi:hypothetical protein
MTNSGHDLPTRGDSSHRIPISHRLGCDNYIWLDTLVFETPELTTDTTETSLYLIRDHQSAILSGQVGQSFEVAIRHWDNACYAHDRFDPDTGDFVVAG